MTDDAAAIADLIHELTGPDWRYLLISRDASGRWTVNQGAVRHGQGPSLLGALLACASAPSDAKSIQGVELDA